MQKKYEHNIRFEPGWELDEEYGRRDMWIRFVCKGEDGAVQFLMSSGWYLDLPPHPPKAFDLGYHSREPITGHETEFDECDILGGKCYYDGSGLQAEPILEKFLREGEEAVWEELEEYYQKIFES